MIELPTLREDGRVALPNGLRLTLQRTFAEDWRPEGERPPRSYGRLHFRPAADCTGFAIPILPDENVWIGIETPDPPVIAELTLEPQAGGTALTRTCPPDHAIKGVPVGDGYRAIAAGDVLILSIRSVPGAAPCNLHLVAYPADEVLERAARSRLAPLDRKAGFCGERLP